MGGCALRSSVFAALLALALPLRAQSGIDEAFADGRYDLALDAIDGLSDPVLAAQWRFQVLHAAGDYPGALHAARTGLDHAPKNLALLQNAANCALTLGEGALALQLCEQWSTALQSAPEAERAAGLERVARYRTNASEQVALDEAAAGATRRARWTALGLLTLALAALGFLVRR